MDESYQGGLQRIISPSSKFADSKVRQFFLFLFLMSETVGNGILKF